MTGETPHRERAVNPEEKKTILERMLLQVKYLKDNWSDEIPEEMIDDEFKGTFLGEDKVRKNWFQHIVSMSGSIQHKFKDLPPDVIKLEKELMEAVRGKERVEKEDIKLGNTLLDGIYDYLITEKKKLEKI